MAAQPDPQPTIRPTAQPAVGLTEAPGSPGRPERKRLRRAAPYLLFGGLALLFYLPLLLWLATFPDGDFTHHFLPFSLFQQQELLAGRLPVWNPYTYGGHPFLADVQAAVFYPLSTLLLGLTLPWTDPGARLYFLQLEAVVQVALAGIFAYWLGRDLTRSRAAGLAAGLLFAFSGYLTGYPPLQLAVLRTAIWLPLILWLLLRGVQEPRRWRWWIGLGVAGAVAFLAGHSQTFLFVLYTAGAWAVLLFVLRVRAAERRGQMTGHLLLGLAVAGLIALGLSAPQLLPSVEFAGLSVRANVAYDFVSGGFPLQDTWQLLMPGVLTQFSPLYVGVVGLGLAWLGVWWIVSGKPLAAGQTEQRWLPTPRAGAAFFLAAALVALLLSYGSNGFLYPVFYYLAPGWNLFRGQERAAYIVALGLSVLAGYGFAALRAMPGPARSWWATLYAAGAIAGVYVFGLLWQLPGRTAVSQPLFLLIALLTVLLASAFAVLLRLPGWSTRRTAWLLALAALNLFWANMATNLDAAGPARKVLLAPEAAALQQAVQETAIGASGLPGRTYNEFRAYEDVGMRLGVEDVWGASPLRLARYARLFEEFPLDRMWRLLGVEHVLTWRKELFGPSTLLGEFPQATDTTFLHRLPGPIERAWIAPAAQVVDDAAAVTLLADHTFDLGATALLAGEPQPGTAKGPVMVAPTGSSPASAPPGTLRLTRLAPAELQVQVEDGPAGVLVVSENWMPGWRVQELACAAAATDAPCAEGAVLPTGPAFVPQRADLTLLGIPVPAGSYQFTLSYQPDSIRFGLWIGGITLIGLALAAAVLWRKGKL